MQPLERHELRLAQLWISVQDTAGWILQKHQESAIQLPSLGPASPRPPQSSRDWKLLQFCRWSGTWCPPPALKWVGSPVGCAVGRPGFASCWAELWLNAAPWGVRVITQRSSEASLCFAKCPLLFQICICPSFWTFFFVETSVSSTLVSFVPHDSDGCTSSLWRRQKVERKQGAAKSTAKSQGGEISMQCPNRVVFSYSQLRRFFFFPR